MCPLCKGELICGWWCGACGVSKDHAAGIVRVRKAFEQPPWGILVVFVGFILLFVVAALTHR